MFKRSRFKFQTFSLFTCFSVIFSAFFYILFPLQAQAADIVVTSMTRGYTFSEKNIDKTNTYLPSEFSYDHEYSFDYDISGEFNGRQDDYGDYGIFEGNQYGDVYADVEHDFVDGFNYFWYIGEMASIFTASPDCYGYRVVMARNSKNKMKFENAVETRWLCGTPTDLLNGANVGNYDGIDVERVAFWIQTDHASVQIRVAPIFRFASTSSAFLDGYDVDVTYGSYDIDANYTFTIEGYASKAEYSNALNNISGELKTQTGIMDETLDAINNQSAAVNNQLYSIKNGYDSSSADKINDDFSSSLLDYQETEDSLFNSAKQGLSNFSFVDFSTYPALVTAMSFTTSMMTSIYNAMGGSSGPIGIVLSILFSVMLISLVLLAKFFQSNGRGGGDP